MVLEAAVMESRSLWNLRFDVAIASGMVGEGVVYCVCVRLCVCVCIVYRVGRLETGGLFRKIAVMVSVVFLC